MSSTFAKYWQGFEVQKTKDFDLSHSFSTLWILHLIWGTKGNNIVVLIDRFVSKGTQQQQNINFAFVSMFFMRRVVIQEQVYYFCRRRKATLYTHVNTTSSRGEHSIGWRSTRPKENLLVFHFFVRDFNSVRKRGPEWFQFAYTFAITIDPARFIRAKHRCKAPMYFSLVRCPRGRSLVLRRMRPLVNPNRTDFINSAVVPTKA